MKSRDKLYRAELLIEISKVAIKTKGELNDAYKEERHELVELSIDCLKDAKELLVRKGVVGDE